MSYRKYPPNAPRPWALALVVALLALTIVVAARSEGPRSSPTFQGKSAEWWALRAQQARRDANARAVTVKRLRRTLAHSPSVEESIRLAAIVYPQFTEDRAWSIIRHESWMTADPLHARNRSSSATGLYQFLVSTFNSTPFADESMYSPYAQSLAAGWMHAHGRGCEWQIHPC